MIANLIAFNAIEGRTSSGSVEFSGNPNDVIQLMIGEHKHFFDHEGNLLSSMVAPTCISINNHGTCAQISNHDCNSNLL